MPVMFFKEELFGGDFSADHGRTEHGFLKMRSFTVNQADVFSFTYTSYYY